MLIPQPESDLSINILVLAGEIIEKLKTRKKYVIVEEIMMDFLKKDKKRSPNSFLDALVFLFSLGIIEYKGYKIRLKRNGSSKAHLF